MEYPRVKGKQPIGTSKDFPYVLMTSRIAEHRCAGSLFGLGARLVPVLPKEEAAAGAAAPARVA